MTAAAMDQAGAGRPARSRSAAVLDVLLRPVWVEGIGCRYDVILNGETIVCRSRDPEHNAARALLARGFRGKYRTIDFFTGRPRMIIDIAKAARLRVIEPDDGSVAVGPYRPMSAEARMLLRPHTSHQGGVIPERAVSDTRDRPEPAGGETAQGWRAIPAPVVAVAEA